MKIQIKTIQGSFAVCQVQTIAPDLLQKLLDTEYCFIGKTDEELSLVCRREDVPLDVKCEDGWQMFGIAGVLDFSLVGILAPIAQILADAKIGIFAVSTYNTDYILVKEQSFLQALQLLKAHGYEIL